MNEDKLRVAQVAPNQPKSPIPTSQQGRREQIQGTMERMWLQNPAQFNPERDCIQRQRLERTLNIINQCLELQGRKGVDLGCGSGVFTRKLRDSGASLDAVDVASQALNLFRETNCNHIKLIQDCLPRTRLNDSDYDLVVCTEVIGFLNPKEYRLLFAELSRLVKTNGVVICSTTLDANTENPLELFSQLADSEFDPLHWSLSYHRLYLWICHLLERPLKNFQICCSQTEKTQLLQNKTGFALFINRLRYNKIMQGFWWVESLITTPLAKAFRQSDKMRDALESLSRFFSSPSGASHVIFAGKRRPLQFPLPPNEVPKEQKRKREVWE